MTKRNNSILLNLVLCIIPFLNLNAKLKYEKLWDKNNDYYCFFKDTLEDNHLWINQKHTLNEIISATNHILNDTFTQKSQILKSEIYNEMGNRLTEYECNYPFFLNGYWYFKTYPKNKKHPLYTRKKINSKKEEIVLDCNSILDTNATNNVVNMFISPNNELLIYHTDTTIRGIYFLKIRNIKTQAELNESIFPTNGTVAWAQDNKTFFYGTSDYKTGRANYIWKHSFGESFLGAEIIFEEKDTSFQTKVYSGKSQNFIYILSRSETSTEFRYILSSKANEPFKVIQLRKKNMIYYVQEHNNNFFILTNKNYQNFELMWAPIGAGEVDQWKPYLKYHLDTLIKSFQVFQNYIVLEKKIQGLSAINIISLKDSVSSYIKSPEPTYSISIDSNYDYQGEHFTYMYTSLKTPNRLISHNMKSHLNRMINERKIAGKFNQDEYETERIWMKASDGALIPISLVYKKSLKKSTGNPTLLCGFGNYGETISPNFSSNRLSLLDRGWIYAIAHTRGGNDLGEFWHDEGRLLKKKNVFNDFISCGQGLIAAGYSNPKHLYAMSSGYGGILAGAVINMRPELWRGVIVRSPVVDVIHTMLNPKTLTSKIIYEEWGNPKDEIAYRNILSYSPYHNVKESKYPNILINYSQGLNNIQLQETFKWAVKIKESQSQINSKSQIYLITSNSNDKNIRPYLGEDLHNDAIEFSFLQNSFEHDD